ncbi:hypothetical protein MKZ38_008223 [Zalerion maritima]|uniref:Uncharacterized protein n=1 Tax=Zalerion maritima TaxID=339359 RepID=A0AAD5WP92_9PEZI|nr:hypothetical protein MKZ38_008223 [Zalerion maritima]
MTQLFQVSISIYRGEPQDYQRYRHAALCFRPTSTSAAGMDAPPSPPLSSTSAPTSSPPTQPELALSADNPKLMQGPALVLHAVENNEGWELSVAASVDPSGLPNKSFATEVPVGMLTKTLSKAQLVSVVSQTTVDNEDPEFNSQVWVEAVLTRLTADSLLKGEDYHNGLDAMVDATMEAADELAM